MAHLYEIAHGFGPQGLVEEIVQVEKGGSCFEDTFIFVSKIKLRIHFNVLTAVAKLEPA